MEPEANTWGQRVKSHETGHGTKVAIAPLEGEGQALMLMDHPNITWVLDDRVTATGRPCLVLQRVRGTKITNCCDQDNLDQGVGSNLALMCLLLV